MKKQVLILALIFLSFNKSFSQDCIDLKYITAINYLLNSEEVISEVKILVRSKKSRKEILHKNLLTFSIFNHLSYISNSYFKKEILASPHLEKDFKDKIKNVEKNWKSKYYEPIPIPQLSKLPTQNLKSKLVLFFSKPEQNTLMAEFFYDPEWRSDHKDNTRQGSGLKVLFIFDNSNYLKEVYFLNLIYH